MWEQEVWESPFDEKAALESSFTLFHTFTRRPPSGDSQGVDLGGMIQSYGRKFVHADSGIALQYYMLASVVRGNSIAGVKAGMGQQHFLSDG